VIEIRNHLLLGHDAHFFPDDRPHKCVYHDTQPDRPARPETRITTDGRETLIPETLKNTNRRRHAVAEFLRAEFKHYNRPMSADQRFCTAEYCRLMSLYVDLDKLYISLKALDAIETA